MASDQRQQYAQSLFESKPFRVSDLAETDFPAEPGIYMFTEDVNVPMYIGMAAQGIRERVY